MAKRRRSKRKKNQYIKPPRTIDQVVERMRQARAGGKHGKRSTDRWNTERRAVEDGM
jgi:hypothetical protein